MKEKTGGWAVCNICGKPARYGIQPGFMVWKLGKDGAYAADASDFQVMETDIIGELFCAHHAKKEELI